MTASAAHSILPPLSAEEMGHSRAATSFIRAQLEAAGGWLSFERFMELALYTPGVGYYSAGSIKIGPGGDFVTAPEVSDLFSRCVARQCADILRQSGGEVLELGAGTGRMAAAILIALAGMDSLPERYSILEVSADLAQRQQSILANLPPGLRERVVWLDSLPQAPLRGVILANEVLDALPCQRFVMRGDRPHPLGVALEGDRLAWREKTATSEVHSAQSAATELAALESLIAELPQRLPERYASEVCWRVAPWIGGIGHCLEQGALLLFDYGLPRRHYYHPGRIDGTLRCHFKQHAHEDPFINIAVQDITAWVDFTRVAEAAVDTGLEVRGFATQAAFLLGTGIEQLLAEVRDPVQQARLAGEARRLLLPTEMGEAFKVMALTREVHIPLSGFAHQDLRASL